MQPFTRILDFSPWRLSGVVVSACLNDPAALGLLGAAVSEPPYKTAPRAPVLAVRPRNTLTTGGDPVEVPVEPGVLVCAAALGVIIGRTASAVSPAQAIAKVAGYLPVIELSLPLSSHYRPAVRQCTRDGSCIIGPVAVAASDHIDPDDLAIAVEIDGMVAQTGTTGRRVRDLARLIADISEFMTLNPGDLLLTGALAGAPSVRAGQRTRVSIERVGELVTDYVAEAGAG